MGRESTAVDAFYRGIEITFCDFKYLQNMCGKSNFEAKVFVGQKILNGDVEIFRCELKYAKEIGAKKGILREYRDAVNPLYNYKDVEKLAKYMATPSAWDAKLKIESLLELPNGNRIIQQNLRRAR